MGQPGRRPELLGFTSKINSLRPITEPVSRNPRKSLPRNQNRSSCFGKFLVWPEDFGFVLTLFILDNQVDDGFKYDLLPFQEN